MPNIKYSTISLPLPLVEKIKREINGTGFGSVSSYVEYVLREMLVEKNSTHGILNKEATNRVKDKLRALGYLN